MGGTVWFQPSGGGLRPHQEALLLCFGSWQFACINLWDTCVRCSEDLQSSPANTPLLVHRIDILATAPEAGLLYLDEIILADTNVTGDHHICPSPGPACQMPISNLHTRDCSSFPKERMVLQLACCGLKAYGVGHVCLSFHVFLDSCSLFFFLSCLSHYFILLFMLV